MSRSVRGPQDHGWSLVCRLHPELQSKPQASPENINGAHGERVGMSVDKSIQL